MRAGLPLPPHSQDGFLNWQRRVQPAIHVATMGLVQPEHQPAVLGIGFSLDWKGDGGWGQGWKQPGARPTLLSPSHCLLDGLQHNGGGGHSEGTPGGHRRPAWGGQHQQREVEAVGCLDNASILERAWARGRKGMPGAKAGRDAGQQSSPPHQRLEKPRFGEKQRRGEAALTSVRHQRICELMAPHVSSGIGGLRSPQAARRVGMNQAGISALEDLPQCWPQAWEAHHSQ